jgi:hypothetical protein
MGAGETGPTGSAGLKSAPLGRRAGAAKVSLPVLNFVFWAFTIICA